MRRRQRWQWTSMMHSESYRTPNGSIFVKMVHTIPYRINKVCSVFRFFSIWGKLHVQVSSDDDCVEGCCYFVYFSSRWRKSSNSVSQNDAWWKNLGLLKIFVFSSSEHHLCLTVNMYWSFFCHISSLIQCYCLHDTSLGCSLSRYNGMLMQLLPKQCMRKEKISKIGRQLGFDRINWISCDF